MHFRPFYVTSVMFVLLACGCGASDADFKKALNVGITSLKWPQQMQSLFGQANYDISYFGISYETQIWHTEVFLWERYQLTLEMPVKISLKNGGSVEAKSPAKFYLNEIKSVEKLQDGR